jgi:hypothetical protein
MPKEKAKPIFEQAGMDFFDQHPYTFDVDDFNREAEFDGPSRPLTFTEWGGKVIGQSQMIMQNSVDRLLDLVDSHQLAGHVFWGWNDMRQYTRIDWEMRDAVLESGVATEERELRAVPYMELSRLFEERRHVVEPADTQAREAPLRWTPWSRKNTFLPLDLQPLADSAEGAKAWSTFEERMAKFWAASSMARDQWKRTGGKFLLWQGSEVTISGVLFRTPLINNYARPLVVTPEMPEVSIPVQQECVRLHVLGHVTFPNGFPVMGKDGEAVGSYTLRYASGKTREILLRNGYEVVRSNMVHEATRIDPEATEAQRALVFAKDIAREQYQILLFSIPVEGGKLASLHCKLNGQQPALAIFAVTAERE